MVDEKGIPKYDIKEGVAWDNIEFTDDLRQLALNTQVVCFGSLAQRNTTSRSTIEKFLNTMPNKEGNFKIFDINLRQNFYSLEVIDSSLKHANILKINDDELVIICVVGDMASENIGFQSKVVNALWEVPLRMISYGGSNYHVSLVIHADDKQRSLELLSKAFF